MDASGWRLPIHKAGMIPAAEIKAIRINMS
jgi:hypothetical protein